MNFDQFTKKAVEAIGTAQETALRKGNQEIETEHIHLALAAQSDGLIPKLLSYMGCDVNAYIQDVETLIEKIPRIQGEGTANVYMSRMANNLLMKAQDESKQFSDEYTGVEHIFIALLRERKLPSQ